MVSEAYFDIPIVEGPFDLESYSMTDPHPTFRFETRGSDILSALTTAFDTNYGETQPWCRGRLEYLINQTS
jgi:hypothetical protein